MEGVIPSGLLFRADLTSISHFILLLGPFFFRSRAFL
jgi:hypothetical protein